MIRGLLNPEMSQPRSNVPITFALAVKTAADIGARALDDFGDEIPVDRPRRGLYPDDILRLHGTAI